MSGRGCTFHSRLLRNFDFRTCLYLSSARRTERAPNKPASTLFDMPPWMSTERISPARPTSGIEPAISHLPRRCSESLLQYHWAMLDDLVAGDGFEPPTSWLWATWATSALPRYFSLCLRWCRPNILSYERPLALRPMSKGPSRELTRINRHIFDFFIVAPEGLEPPTFWLWVNCC